MNTLNKSIFISIALVLFAIVLPSIATLVDPPKQEKPDIEEQIKPVIESPQKKNDLNQQDTQKENEIESPTAAVDDPKVEKVPVNEAKLEATQEIVSSQASPEQPKKVFNQFRPNNQSGFSQRTPMPGPAYCPPGGMWQKRNHEYDWYRP